MHGYYVYMCYNVFWQVGGFTQPWEVGRLVVCLYWFSSDHNRRIRCGKLEGYRGALQILEKTYEQMKKRAPSCLGYIGDYTTQLFRDCKKTFKAPY